jgi:hypothetical protein
MTSDRSTPMKIVVIDRGSPASLIHEMGRTILRHGEQAEVGAWCFWL